jgi:hypothetical protein
MAKPLKTKPSTRPGISLVLRKKYFNLCNPERPLEPTDAEYVNVDDLQPKARGLSAIEGLAQRIELSDGPVCALFTGLPGSGKSTELRRLAVRLADPKRANLLPVLIDAEEVLDLYTTIDVPDVLMAILYKTEVVLLESEGKTAKDALKDTITARLWNWLTATEVGVPGIDLSAGAELGLPGAELGLPGAAKVSAGAKVVMTMKTSETLRQEVRRRLATKMTAFVGRITAAMTELNERAIRRKHAGLVVIFDSLEKLRGGSTTWENVLKSAEDVFKGGAPNLKLPVHTIYTMPAALTYRMNIDVSFLPMLKLVDREGRSCEEGVAAAREIIRKRVPDEHLREFLGATNVDRRVARLLEWSGGYPREIVRLLQLCVQQPVLDEERFEQLLAIAGDQLCRMVPESAYAWLARVHVTKDPAASKPEERPMIDELLQNNIVLRYQNQRPWFDIHPAVRMIPGVESAIVDLLEPPAKV